MSMGSFVDNDLWRTHYTSKKEVNALFICKPSISQGFKGFGTRKKR